MNSQDPINRIKSVQVRSSGQGKLNPVAILPMLSKAVSAARAQQANPRGNGRIFVFKLLRSGAAYLFSLKQWPQSEAFRFKAPSVAGRHVAGGCHRVKVVHSTSEKSYERVLQTRRILWRAACVTQLHFGFASIESTVVDLQRSFRSFKSSQDGQQTN